MEEEPIMNIDIKKNISIKGTSTRYQMKKIINDKQLVKRKKYDALINCTYDKQIEIINNIKNGNISVDSLLDKSISEIKHKLSSYKQQDILKEIYDKEKFINFDLLINLLDDSKLKCEYCSTYVYILYELVRYNKQWTLDRIDNNKGHNKDNVVIACLECNLKRRNTNKDAFMYTKNLKIIRENYIEDV
jgi:hypothetical protein